MELKSIRIKKHLTQADVASYLGIARNTYTQYEQGLHKVPPEILCKLADFFDVTVDELLGRTPQLFDDARIERPEIIELYELMTPQQQSNLINYARGMLAASAPDEQFYSTQRRKV